MKRSMQWLTTKLLLLAVVCAGTIMVNAGPAAAADDTFFVTTAWNGCTTTPNAGWKGFAQFQDYGPGAPGGGDNDDYIIVGDSCADGRGVKAWAWVDGNYKGAKYIGTGAGTSAVWDPLGNVPGGHSVGLKVCSVVGNDDSTALWCESATRTIDG